MESRRIPALSHFSKANIFMTSGPEHPSIPSSPMSAARRSRRRRPGRSAMTASFGPLINLSQAVPGNAPHPELLGAPGRHRRLGRGRAIRADQRRCALCGRPMRPSCPRIYEGRIEPRGHGDHGRLQHGLLRRHDAARPSRRRGAAADALVLQPPDEPRHARHRAASAALPAGGRIRAAGRGCGGADRRARCGPSCSSRPTTRPAPSIRPM